MTHNQLKKVIRLTKDVDQLKSEIKILSYADATKGNKIKCWIRSFKEYMVDLFVPYSEYNIQKIPISGEELEMLKNYRIEKIEKIQKEINMILDDREV